MYAPMIVHSIVAAFSVSLIVIATASRVAVFGATGGVGQQICASLKRGAYQVTALSRSAGSCQSYPLLTGCELHSVDISKLDNVEKQFVDVEHIVISIGTTAFPSSNWNGGNNPETSIQQ